MEQPKIKVKKIKKRKLKTNINAEASQPKVMKTTLAATATTKQTKSPQKTALPKVMYEGLSIDEIGNQYPVLKNEELVNKFLSVSMTNNQKGRIRQLLKDNLKGTSELLLPDVIHNRIQTILKSSATLTDTDLRKIRILYNMLKTAIKTEKTVSKGSASDKEKKVKIKAIEKDDTKEELDKVANNDKNDKGDKGQSKKVKGPKRYVVFIGNLPIEIDKQTLLEHFSELNEYIKDVRIPKRSEEKKSAIAYLEMKTEPSYELALCKHHSMLGNKRINVLYTASKKGKISKAQAKSKSAKLVALQKAGKLIGSVPLNRKRSQRRAKMKKALALQAASA